MRRQPFSGLAFAALAALALASCGGLEDKYSYPVDGYLTFKSDGSTCSVYSVDASASGAIAIPSTVSGARVTAIEGTGFSGLIAITGVSIPSGVSAVPSQCFNGCTSLASVELPASLTSIGEYAFYGCAALTSVVIPDSVTYIGDLAFCGCSSLEDVTLPASLNMIGKQVFRDCALLKTARPADETGADVVLPSNTKYLGGFIFHSCTSIASAEIPSIVTTLPEGLFFNCSAMATLTLEAGSVVGLADYVFYGCPSTMAVNVPSALVDAYGASGSAWLDTIYSYTLPSFVFAAIGG